MRQYSAALSSIVAAGFLIWILGAYGKRDSAAGGEFRGHDHFARGAGFDEIVENAVCHRFIERALVAIRREIKFERFAFDAEAVGHVIDIDSSKIGLTSYRTNGSEIVCLKMNSVISPRSRIRKRLQARFGWRCRKFRVAVPEQC